VAPGELNRRRRDDLADAALRAAREQRQDAFAHPRLADLGGDPVRVLGGCELEDQYEVCVSSTWTTRAAVAPASRMRGTMSRHDCSVSAVSASLRCRWFITTVTAQPYN